MPLRLGLLVYPMFAGALLLSRRGSLSKFIEAKATSPTTARRPSSVGITDPGTLRGPLKRGLLVAAEDGRYYVDMNVYRRTRRRVTAFFVVAGAIIVAMTVIMAWGYFKSS